MILEKDWKNIQRIFKLAQNEPYRVCRRLFYLS